MKHFKYLSDECFLVKPIEFNKYTDRDVLQYCLGASMYMPGTKQFFDKIVNNSIRGLTTIILDFEDACDDDKVDEAENNVIDLLGKLYDYTNFDKVKFESLPLIFCRVRDYNQFVNFTSKLDIKHCKMLSGFNFPKFNSVHGEAYFKHLRFLNEKFSEILYGMPIIEDSTVAYKESRVDELRKIKDILDKYYDIVLQVRVGATDFSSNFGVRRGIEYSIYDILPVRDCLSDIINIFSRNNRYIISGPVWEYFKASKEMMFSKLPEVKFEDFILKRIKIYNEAIDGLLREVILDKANGFVGRTVIHPTHVTYVNALQAVTKEEYDDACQILGKTSGVSKSIMANKMNEIKPHTNWAQKIYMRAKVFGVIKNEQKYFDLF